MAALDAAIHSAGSLACCDLSGMDSGSECRSDGAEHVEEVRVKPCSGAAML